MAMTTSTGASTPLTPDVALGPIGQVALPAADLPATVRFYRDAVGLPLLFEAPPGLAFFDCGGLRLMLAAPEGGGGAATPASGAALYFRVPDIRAAHARLAERGVAFADEPHVVARMPDHDLWLVFFHDPTGNLLALMSEARR